jgi:Zn-dependent peptidase ImmA (M78 family)
MLPGQPPAEEFSTFVHELAHELPHRGDRRESTSRKVRETEAERLPSSFAMPSGSTPDRQRVITSSSGPETWTRLPKV